MLISLTTFEEYKKREARFSFDDYEEEREKVRQIITDVRKKGDQALKEYAQMFDGAGIESLKVKEEEYEHALGDIEPLLLEALEKAKENIEEYHRRQIKNDWWISGDDWLAGQRIVALESVGAYVPGGTAAYPSSVLMTVIPAKVAGVKEVYICTPPAKNGRISSATLAAAKICGATAVFKTGGAQAVAALAYGTETIPAVRKIVGPGNIYVTLAKKEVFGHVGIDMLAGPSEIVIVADEGANPAFIAADLLSQAEHDPLARSILVTPSEALAGLVSGHLEEQLMSLPRIDIARRSLSERGAFILTPTLADAWPIVNELAPEHLELHLEEAWHYIEKIQSAGAIFVGPYAPEPLGDYWAGSNHVLPTGASARFASPLGVDDFIKKSSVLYYGAREMEKAAASVAVIARAEGLEAHARAALIRRKYDEPRGKN